MWFNLLAYDHLKIGVTEWFSNFSVVYVKFVLLFCVCIYTLCLCIFHCSMLFSWWSCTTTRFCYSHDRRVLQCIYAILM